jgi:hypothetical protein
MQETIKNIYISNKKRDGYTCKAACNLDRGGS